MSSISHPGDLGRAGVDRRAEGLPDALCCPECRGEFRLEGDAGGRCSGCGHPLSVLAPGLVGVLGTTGPAVATILGWPDEFLRRVGPGLQDLRLGRPIDPGSAAEFRGHGLIEPGGGLTNLGRRFAYNVLEHEWQATDPQLEAFLDQAGLGPGSRVLDIGCAAGQTLRVLAPRGPAERVGVDVDQESLALGHRLAGLDGGDVRFVHASGHALPFRDGSFSHVISRGALNYMHQGRGLAEVARVLRPGGYLFLRYEALLHDVRKVLHARGWREPICRSRDLGVGVVLSLTGWQREPWRFLGGGRTFVSPRRLARCLGRIGMRVVRAEPGNKCLTVLGHPTQTAILAVRLD